MKNYKLTIQYEGTRYNGWQRQENTSNTIQEKFENILFKLCKKKVEIFSSGRTDAGVHAKGQVANFKADLDLTTDEITDYFNKYLPGDVAVVKTEVVDDRFHARLNAKSKTYEYRIWTGKIPEVFGRRTRYFYEGALDAELMKKGAEFLIGVHDFKAFCTSTRIKKSTVREIYSIEIDKTDSELIISVCGDGFLYNMVRIIVGTLIEIGRGECMPESIKSVLESGERKNAGYTAPPEGLTLLNVKY